jgi:hypothetical protein
VSRGQVDITETAEERMLNLARQKLSDLVGKDLILQTDERAAFQSGEHDRGEQISKERTELALKIDEAEAEYFRCEIAALEVHRMLMHRMLPANARAGIDREIDKKLETANFQLRQNRKKKSQ